MYICYIRKGRHGLHIGIQSVLSYLTNSGMFSHNRSISHYHIIRFVRQIRTVAQYAAEGLIQKIDHQSSLPSLSHSHQHRRGQVLSDWKRSLPRCVDNQRRGVTFRGNKRVAAATATTTFIVLLHQQRARDSSLTDERTTSMLYTISCILNLPSAFLANKISRQIFIIYFFQRNL